MLFRIGSTLFLTTLSAPLGAAPQDSAVVSWGVIVGDSRNAQGTFADVSVGPLHTLALRNDGTLAAWGHNLSGQCQVPSAAAGAKYVA
ncbi:MAG TPA: RCC1 domain-containing protein, partial [Planctomycetota bacterium]|nr:RCC1 domain-containing protein [Planctomycetota bacterium]